MSLPWEELLTWCEFIHHYYTFKVFPYNNHKDTSTQPHVRTATVDKYNPCLKGDDKHIESIEAALGSPPEGQETIKTVLKYFEVVLRHPWYVFCPRLWFLGREDVPWKC